MTLSEDESTRKRMKIFISFSSEDSELVSDLTKALKSRGADVWTYLLEMKPGDSLIDKINEGMSESDHLILVISADSLKSYWVTRELNAAMMLEADKKIKIIPIMIDDSNVVLPPLLKEKIYADFRTNFAKGFRELRSALGLAGMTDTVIHGTANGEREIRDDAYIEEGGMRVLKRESEIYVDMPEQKQYAHINDEEAELRTEHFTAKWDNLRNKLKGLEINWAEYTPIVPSEDILEKAQSRQDGLVLEKYICKFGAEFTLIFNTDRELQGIQTNNQCKTSINVKTKEIIIGPNLLI